MADPTPPEEKEHQGVSLTDKIRRLGWPIAHLVQPCHIHHTQYKWVQQWHNKDLGAITLPKRLWKIHTKEHLKMVDERGFGQFYVHSAGVWRPYSYISQFRKLNSDYFKSFRTMIRLRWGSSMTTWCSQKTWIFRSTPEMCWMGECLLRWPIQVRL